MLLFVLFHLLPTRYIAHLAKLMKIICYKGIFVKFSTIFNICLVTFKHSFK